MGHDIVNPDRERGFLDSVEKMYALTRSIPMCAEKLGISYGKVRKALITLGLWENTHSESVKRLAESGIKRAEIARRLGLSTTTVSSYMPYVNDGRGASDATRFRVSDAIRLMDELTDRVLLPGGDYGFIPPSEGDILVHGGMFVFNLSRLITLCQGKAKVRVDICDIAQYLEPEAEELDEPPVVLEFNPMAVHSDESLDLGRPRYKLLSCHRQVLAAKQRGEKTYDVYLFRMEEYLPFITKWFVEFVRYWNEKLECLLQERRLLPRPIY